MAAKTKFAVIGDPHIATPHGDPDPLLEIDPGRKLHGLSVELLQATIDAVNAEPDLDAVLVMGDLTRDSEEFNHAVARELLAQLKPPLHLVLGNHDLVRERPAGVSYDGVRRFDRQDVLEHYRGTGFTNGTSRYAVELPGGIVLIVLDSNLSSAELAQQGLATARQEDGWIGAQQLGWLSGLLEQIAADGRRPILAVHHSLLEHSPAEHPGHILQSAFRQWRLNDADDLLGVLKQYRVQLVLSGHLHVQSVNVHEGIYNLVTSASVSYPHAWRVVWCDERAIGVETRRVASIPSCPNLQEQSRVWMAHGMEQLIRQRLQNMPLLANLADEVCGFVTTSDWWPRFCDGTLSGFKADVKDAGTRNPLALMMLGQVAGVLSEYGAWKAARPDPNFLELPLI